MKKITLIFMCMAMLSIAAMAQTSLKSQYGLAVDTVTNAATKYLTTGAIKGIGSNGVLSVQVVITEISGTTGGTVTLEGSHDGTNWYGIYTGLKAGQPDSTNFVPADVASQAYRFKVFNFADVYVRVKYTGTGTMSDKISGTWFYRKAD